jgi:hypothetical protein
VPSQFVLKKELVGDFKNAGREWRPQGEPEEVRVHDFLIKELGRAVPYGIYNLAANPGWVNKNLRRFGGCGLDKKKSCLCVSAGLFIT